jgi:hypothetical protein
LRKLKLPGYFRFTTAFDFVTVFAFIAAFDFVAVFTFATGLGLSIAACAAANLAIGTLKGEQLT